MGIVLNFPPKREEVPIEALIGETPIVLQARYLLEAVGEEGLKLTPRGYLPGELTQQFWMRFVQPFDPEFPPNRESDCIELYRLHFLLSDANYLRRRSGKVLLTKKAKAVKSFEMYKDMISVMFFEYNWAFDDQFEEHPEFQRMALEFLNWMAEGGTDELLSAKELYDAHFESYLQRKSEINDDRLRDWAEEPVFCLQTRFFDRFCVPFGLVHPAGTGLYRPSEFLLRHFFPFIADKL